VKDIVLLGIRVIAGGALVVAFAMPGDMLKPKMFSGLFGAAPSVATASLVVSGIAMGASKDMQYATGMIAGAVGLVAYSLAAAFAVKHLGSIAGSIVAWLAWLVPAAATYFVFLT
jgi:type IV secretory pathway TrbD component